MSRISDPLLVACPDLAAYENVALGAAEAGAPRVLPVLDAGEPPLAGLPAGTRWMAYGDWLRHGTADGNGRAAVPGAAAAVCIAVDEPACVAVGRLLARTRGRKLVVASRPDAWEREIAAHARDGSTASLALLLPLWTGEGHRLDPRWLASALACLRGLPPQAALPPWGILTGIDAPALTRLAVKSLLQDGVAESYRQAPAAIVATHQRSVPKLPLARWRPAGGPDAVQWVDELHLAEGHAQQLAGQPWSCLVFHGHGRSYCACNGVLCGARHPGRRPDDPVEACVLGLDCADASYPQIDPRSFRSPVIVLDTCDAASWAAPTWESGIAPVAFLAAAGAASAVIASDGITKCVRGDFFDVLWALRTADGAGRAVARLNHLRAAENVHLPFFLIGDPEVPCGPERWPRWALEARLGSPGAEGSVAAEDWDLEVQASEAPFVSLRLPAAADGGGSARTVFTWSEEPSSPFQGCRVFSNGHPAGEVWVGRSGSSAAAARLKVARRPALSLPPGLIEDARSLALRLSDWSPPLDLPSPRLAAAARRLIHTHQLLEDLAGSGLGASPRQLENLVTVSLSEWMAAQAGCVSKVLEHSGKGLWPHSFWTPRFGRAQALDTPCPICGAAPTVLRAYELTSGLVRRWWECQRCDLLSDLPALEDLPALSFVAPPRLAPDSVAAVTVVLDHRRGRRSWWGTGAVAVDRQGHGVTVEPSLFPLKAQAGERSAVTVSLRLSGRPATSHFYRVRGIFLLNGWWLWASHPLIVAAPRTERVPAAAFVEA